MSKLYWTSKDGQSSIDMSDATEKEAWAELLEQCGSEEERAGILAGTLEVTDHDNDWETETSTLTLSDGTKITDSNGELELAGSFEKPTAAMKEAVSRYWAEQ